MTCDSYNVQKLGKNFESHNKEYSKLERGFIFEIGIGECNMQATTLKVGDDNYLAFTQHFSFKPVSANGRDEALFGKFQFQCQYKAQITTQALDYDITVKAFTHKHNSDGDWHDAFDIQFYTDEQYNKSVQTGMVGGNEEANSDQEKFENNPYYFRTIKHYPILTKSFFFSYDNLP